MEIEYRAIPEEEIDRNLFADFIRHQVVDVCLRREGENWVERSDPFIDDWGEEEYRIHTVSSSIARRASM